MRRLLALVFFLPLALGAVRAQSVRWAASDSGDPSELQLIFQDCSPDNDPQLPRVEGVTFALAGSSSQTTINNFDLSRSTILTYRVRSTRSTPVQIPAFGVQTNKGEIRVAAFTGGAPRSASDLDLSARLTAGATTVWAGEVFPLAYQLDASRRNPSQIVSNLDWNAAPLVAEDWSKPEPVDSVVSGEPRSGMIYHSRAYAKTPGSFALNPASLLVNVQTGSVGFGLFQAPRVEQLTVTSDRPQLSVRPLPPAPADFSGAVGRFKLVSKIVPEKAVVGDPITWTLELGGTGNWPEIAGLPQREVSRDFRVVQPKAKRTPAEGKLFDVTLSEDVVLVPTQPGRYTLGPVAFTYFDPSTGGYQTLTTPRTTVTVTAPAAAPSVAPGRDETPATSIPAASAAAEANPVDLKPKIPTTPGGIPRDPLPGTAAAMVPFPAPTLAVLVLAPFALLLAFWGWLAVRRAQATDPLRPHREARARLAATLAAMKSAPASDLGARLIAWQHDAAILWRIAQAAPAAGAFGDAAWAQLWTEADRTLYGPATALPAGWIERAEAALAAKKVPSFPPLRLFLPRNLFPFVFAAAIALVCALPAPLFAGDASSAEAATAYRRGDFAAAEKTWAAAVAAHPTDAVARHNLSLALAQQDRWAEAAAHASAAFVQNPSDPAIRWQFALACEKAGYAPAPLAAFVPPGPKQSVGRLAPPGAWQLALVIAAALAAAALGALLACGYRRAFGPAGWIAASGLGAAVLLAAVATVGFDAYGVTANRHAVLVWRAGTLRSIPTEADITQKTSPLAAGSLALSGKTLLGWVQLTFENGQTGWVRREELIPLWRP